MPLRDGPWQQIYERALINLTAIGGISIGFGVLLLSPPGLDGTDLVAWLALGTGIAAVAALILEWTKPLPFLIAVVFEVGLAAPFVDLALALALSMILVGILATGAVLLEGRLAFWSLFALVAAALGVRPLLDVLGVRRVEAEFIPVTMTWGVAVIALVLTALGFRALRGQLIEKGAHEGRMRLLISSLAHHIRTPLTPVIGYAYLLEAELKEEPAREYAHRIVSRAWDISNSVDDLVIAARASADDFEVLRRPVELSPLVDSAVEEVPGALERVRYKAVGAKVIGDPTRVGHILKHLITNAVHHGGPVIRIHDRLRGRWAELHITDNGPAFNEEERIQVFEPFYLRPGPEPRLGRGLGLTVSNILAQAMGGGLRIESDHTGNTAVLTLPADPSRAVTIGAQPGFFTGEQNPSPSSEPLPAD